MMRPRANIRRTDVRAHRRSRPGFSLLELLVVIAIITLMIALLGGTLGRVREAARSFECKNKLKSVAFEFFQFADDFGSSHRRRRSAPADKGFDIDDFQEKLYGLDEFWDPRSATQRQYNPARQLLMCPSGPRRLERQGNLPCDSYPVTPVSNVSIGFNMRLRMASSFLAGRPVLQSVRLSSRILRQPSVPLAFDVDGAVADKRRIIPYYSAPPAGGWGRYSSGLFWFPSFRHGSLNACFIGGHVLSSNRPEKAGWNWRYQLQPE
jgi:prepilin-type N-terminal cleavage/methylation domain-containing protein